MDTAPRGVNLRAALSVAGASMSLFCTVGFLNAFGVFQQHYKASNLQNMSESDISWIGSITIFLLYLAAPITGLLVDNFGPRWLLLSGSLGMLLSVFMTSLCTQYYQFFLAQGVLQGISMSFITWPPIAVVSRSLPAHRGLALGIVLSGSSVGGVIWPIMLARLLDHSSLGFGWVMRIVGFMMLPILIIACCTVREPRQQLEQTTTPTTTITTKSPAETGSETELQVQTPIESTPIAAAKRRVQKSEIMALIKNPVFICLSLGLAMAFLGLFVPFFFISSYAIEIGIDPQMSFYLISIVNGASLVGRVGPGHLADRFGHYNICFLAAISSAITAFCWTAAQSLGGLVVISLAYGFTSGAILAVQNACVAKIVGPHMQGTAMGLLMGCMALASLGGGPIGGALLTRYGYLSVSMYTGASLAAGSILIAAARFLLNKNLASPV
ncbi:putative MFS monocarboxylate transporter [Cercophora newfieldiana]|uniref:MFS monocarboxylate transporter n=1 Tax=Cercophora newfieldiana TaxID=92897 RepID=A0AA39YBI1_9PEZI|nr:putative MFS monocarboxylate transporter [Cercophora newfieldiana]